MTASRRIPMLLASALLLGGCMHRSSELKRESRLDAECRSGTSGYTYAIASKLDEQIVESRCYAPIGAWTDEHDVAAGGARKLVHDLRANDKLTLVCCL